MGREGEGRGGEERQKLDGDLRKGKKGGSKEKGMEGDESTRKARKGEFKR